MFRHYLSIAAICLFVTTTAAQAQILSQHHSSTLEEGIRHGQADVIRADGERARNVSEAARNFEAANAESLKNDVLSVQGYYEKKALHDEYEKSQKKSAPLSSPTTVAKSAPAGCSADQLSADGTIAFPPALQGEACKVYRKQLEMIFSHRAAGSNTAVGTPDYDAAKAAIGALSADLKARINNLPTTQYIAARKLLSGLERELGRMPERSLVASN